MAHTGNGAAVDDVIVKASACIEAAQPNADGSNTYCIPVDLLDALSASLAELGGAR